MSEFEDEINDHVEPAPVPKFGVGDRIKVPCHNGHYVAEVIKIYSSLGEAVEKYERSFRTILQAPRGKPAPDQFFYYAEVCDNRRPRQGIAVAEEHAELKSRAGR